MTLKHYVLIFLVAISVTACGAYSFTGAKVNPNTKTFQVNYFQNNSILIEPGLDLDFTNALTDLLLNQTNLSLVKSNGDLVFEGEITEYRISPTTATAENTAAQNRLTISVNVRFYNKQDEESEFEKRFSFFYDYAGTAQLVGSQKVTAIDEIFERLTQDIFNAALAQW
ncbi:putative lipoprotein assembly protein LptE [Formosa agariphila KMM 3901]|uniref:Putative lipoprotein assembly protein LptE n=1 Tax=Formosa agariphila (strain DSM 15362 / KCTC 12365 / LMG 23005 / KMM 3901 / M-2Alg 35-1) TaxID=1347342 RepID=T2KI87_FORAG|nr:LptE family protein [Formosa agariphila]CDF78141.1 putative lipoprotein assembly protein LptE [Formosa agariphila KMM 3901]